MVQCNCLNNNGLQCRREGSHNPTENKFFCWQHQKCNHFINDHSFPDLQPIKNKTTKKNKKINKKQDFNQKQDINPIQDLAFNQKQNFNQKQDLNQKQGLNQKQDLNQTQDLHQKQPINGKEPTKEKQLTNKKEKINKKKLKKEIDTIQILQEIYSEEMNSSRRLKQLSGPYLFAFYPNLIGRRILLIGETHHIQDLCPITVSDPKNGLYEIHDWLFDLTKNAPECVDLFIEQDYLLKSNIVNNAQSISLPLSKYNAPIHAIRDRFKNCYTPDPKIKIKCHSNQLRYHYIDVRAYVKTFIQPYSEWHDAGFNIIEKSFHLDSKYWHVRQILFSYILGIDRSQFALNLINMYNTDLAKLLGVTYDESKNNNYMKIYYSNIDKEIRKLDPRLHINRFLKSIMQTYLDQSNILSCLFLSHQDIYFMLRLFTIYDQKKMDRGPTQCHDLQYQKNKNVVVYTGANHTQIYIDILNKYFTTLPTIYIKNSNVSQCLKFDKPFDFFAKD